MQIKVSSFFSLDLVKYDLDRFCVCVREREIHPNVIRITV